MSSNSSRVTQGAAEEPEPEPVPEPVVEAAPEEEVAPVEPVPETIADAADSAGYH